MHDAIFIIPARGGSKRIPKKNIRDFAGRPMIEHAIRIAEQSEISKRVIVSTDDEEIARIAIANGAEVPFLRDTNLSDDMTGTTPVVIDVIERLALNDDTPVILLYATVPILNPSTLNRAFRNFCEEQPEFVMAVTPFRSAPERALILNDEGKLEPKHPEFVFARSQDIQPSYQDAGQFYMAHASVWKSSKHPYLSNTLPIEVSPIEVCDIDTSTDWEFAELQYKYLKNIQK